MAHAAATGLYRPFAVQPNPIIIAPPSPVYIWVYMTQQATGTAKLLAVDATDPTKPTVKTSTTIENTAYHDYRTPRHIQVDTNYLYYSSNNTFYIRANNTSNPSLISATTLSGIQYATGALMKFGNLYVDSCLDTSGGLVGGNSGCYIVDVTNPVSPSVTSVYYPDNGSYGLNLAQKQNGAFDTNLNLFRMCTAASGGFSMAMRSADTTNPFGAWSRNDLWSVGGKGDQGPAVIVGTHLYQLCSHYGVFEAQDITSAIPVAVTPRIALTPNTATPDAWKMYYKNGYLILIYFVTTSYPTIYTYSLASPAAPSLVKSTQVSDGTTHSGNEFFGVCFQGNYMYLTTTMVTSGNSNLWIFDMSDPTNPILLNGSNGTVLVAGGGTQYYAHACGCYPNSLTTGNNYII